MKEDKIARDFHQAALVDRSGRGYVCFNFEEDFVENNVRCIPMAVRFKLDECGIKLKLCEWNKMIIEERKKLCEFVCVTKEDLYKYRHYLKEVIFNRTGNVATELPVEENPAWTHRNELPLLLVEKLAEFNWYVSLPQWQSLTNLQRFVLMKLSKPGHENKNFPKAVKEFGLV